MTAWNRALLGLLVLLPATLGAAFPAAAQVAQDRSAAVVFFGTNEGGEAEVDDFTHGILEAAGKDAAVRVVAPEGLDHGAKPDPAKVAAAAKVRFVFVAEIHREDADFAVAARLVDAQTGREVWNGRFFSDEDDLLQLPGEIATSLVAQLKAAAL
jgi:TolB-like protein